jgi:5'-deoxynucleotidase YfbR-like HD superfamily hydrolase
MYPDFVNPEIYLNDMITAMCNYRRFNGFVDYTIMEHTMNVTLRLPPELRIHGLLHDAAEVYSWDIVRPLSHFLTEEAKKHEHNIKTKIYNTMELVLPTLEEYERVIIADNEINKIEGEIFKTNHYLQEILYREPIFEKRFKTLKEAFLCERA